MRALRSRVPKTLSLSMATVVVGGVVSLSGYGASHSAALTSRVGAAAAELGLGVTVTSTSIVLGIVALKLASSLFPRFGRKYAAFLHGFGLRP